MSKFKVGEWVRVTKSSLGNNKETVGKEGKIITVNSDLTFPYSIEGISSWQYKDEELEHIHQPQDYQFSWDFAEEVNKPKSIMKTLSNTIKKYVNGDIQSQLKAGFRNGDLELTQRGINELLEIVAEKHKDDFTLRAKEVIAEEEKKN